MAKIVINEVSQNYSWSIGNSSYATVALPITSSWGPGYFDPATEYPDPAEGEDPVAMMLEHTVWQRYPANQAGLDAFVSTYRGPASNYRLAKDFSYQQAVTLLTAGYDVLVCRICPGKHAQITFAQFAGTGASTTLSSRIDMRAKYPGTFGNNIQIAFNKAFYYDSVAKVNKYYWNIITYIVDVNGVKTAVESKTCVFNLANSTDSILYYKEIESNFWEIQNISGTIIESASAANIVASAVGNITEYSADETYAKDEVCLHENKIYKCNADDTTGAWDVTKWSDVTTTYSNGFNYGQLGSQSASDVGTDYDTAYTASSTADWIAHIQSAAQPRFNWAAGYQQSDSITYKYPEAIGYNPGNPSATPPVPANYILDGLDDDARRILYYREWLFTALVGSTSSDGVFDLLKDKLAYNPNRIISPGWDDQDFYMYTDDESVIKTAFGFTDPDKCQLPISPIHLKIMDVAYYSRCATGYIDVPHLISRNQVHIEDESNPDNYGYAQELARMTPANAALDVNGTLFHTHCAFFAPWAQFQYVGTSKMNVANPSFLALMIQRAQILNQATQYEWALPTNRKHNLRIGKLDYTVPKKLLDQWQKLEGASVNVITTIPDLGTNIWGNSTLFEVPPATYQALANLSTRFLVNAVEDCAYRCGIGITFQYNNGQAYNKFYAGVTPLLDTMRNVGAIEDYRVEMSADINSLDHVNANTVIGKIWLIVNGVINDIYVDLVALPAGLGIDLNSLS